MPRYYIYTSRDDGGCPIEAVNFILAHEAATGQTMDMVQRMAMCGYVSRLKGNNTTNGSDILSALSGTDSVIYPLCPIDDTTANASAYSMELLRASSFGTYNNFVSGDFTENGVIGGTTKYFDCGVSTDDLGTQHSLITYSRTDQVESSIVMGTWEGSNTNATYLQPRISPSRAVFRHSSNSSIIIDPVATSDGMLLISRSPVNAIFYEIDNIKQGSGDYPLVPTGTSANNVYFHAQNRAGVAGNYATHQLSFYAVIPYLSTAERQDFYEATLWLQQNIITGGRDV